MGYGLRADAIVGYTFNADQYCTQCAWEVLSARHTAQVDQLDPVAVEHAGWVECIEALGSLVGIDVQDERSYDSGDFPKVIFAVQVDGPESCGGCGADLIDG